MKRLISILVLVAMMLTSFAATISAVADEIVEGGETETPVVETEKVYNVNWKELVDKGVMRATWIGHRGAHQNNMNGYNVIATETALKLEKTDGNSRAYFFESMFDITADTQYELVFKADKTNDNCADAGVIFAWAAYPNAYSKQSDHFVDGVDDIYPGIPKGAYHIMADWGAKTDYKVHFGGPNGEYSVFDTGSKTNLTDVKVDEENFATYKVVYNGLQIKLYFLNNADEWVEFFADKNMTLIEGSKITLGLNTWSPSHTNLKDCVITAKNEAAVAAMNAALTADKTAYEAKLAETKTFVEADWLPADWAKFTAKINEAKAMAADAEYKYELEYAMAKIDVAVKTLSITASAIKPAVEKLITEVDAIVTVPENQALYTEASWGRMTAALEAAKTTVANAEAKQSDLVAAYNVLLATKKGLLTKELAAKSTYNVNWKYFYENNMMRSQWWWDNSDSQNNYLSLFKVIATETYLGSDPIGEADNRSYYSTMMLDITENTYYEYTFEAKNDRAGGYAGILFAYDTNDFPYFVYGQFDNSSDNAGTADFRYRKGHQDRNSDGHNSAISTDRHYPVLDLTAEGYGQFKYVYDGYNFSFYAMTEGELKLIWTYTLPQGSKIAYGVYNRGGKMDADPEKDDRRTMSLQNATIVAYNEAAAEIIVNTASATAIKVAEAKLADTYTPATEKAVSDAMAVVKAIKADTPAAEVDAAIAALQTAILGLKKADKTALIAAIEAANAAIADKTAADFEERYYTPFATALAAAIAANDNVNATQEEVDAALAELVKTQKYLTLAGAACKVDLADILAVYAKLVEADYKPSSWATLAAPFATANGLNENAELTNADQTAIDEAVVALDNAIKALVKRANYAKLQAIYDRAVALDVDDYTNWTELDMAAIMASAAETLENLELDQPAVDAAFTTLNDAVNALLTWRSNVLAIVPADDYQVNDTVSYPNPDWYNKITDMAYHGLGNVFYYDYHKFVAQQGIVPGTKFDKSLGDTGYAMQGSGDHTIRLGTNVSGNGSNRVTDGVKEGGTDLSHRATPVSINGKVYGHAFGFAFLKAPTVDSIAVYLPTDTKIVSIDVYGAVLTKDAAGNTLYGKADKAAITTDADGVQCEDATTTKKIYLGTINVPAAVAGAANIMAAGDFAQAMKVDYIYFALTMAEGTGKNAYYGIKEIELFGLADGQTVNGKAAPNFAAVNAAYAAFMDCVKADYTEASWAAVEAVLEQYKDVINNLKADQADVDAAAAALDAAVKALIANPANWTDLDAAITTGSTVTLDAYTPNTFNPFKAAYDAAVALRAASNVPQTKVDAALKALTDAIAALAKRADTTALKAALEEAKKLKEEEWNADKIKWKMFNNSVVAAEELLANENATQAEVDKVVEDLAFRKSELKAVEAPVTPPAGEGDNNNGGDAGNTETEAPDATEAPDETEATQKATESEKETEEEKKKGCGSSVALSALAIVGVIGTAVVLKKKED